MCNKWLEGTCIFVWEMQKRVKAKKRVKLFDYYLRKGGISSARVYLCKDGSGTCEKRTIY